MTNLELVERALAEALHNMSKKDSYGAKQSIKYAMEIIADLKKEETK